MKLTNLIKLFAFSLLLLGVPAVASAQWGGGGNNGGYGNGGYNNGNLKYTIQRVQSQARNFERSTDNYGYGNIENLADDFKRAADRLEDRFGNGRNMNNSYDAASRLVQIAQQIDNQLRYNGNGRGGRGGRGGNDNGAYQWNQIRSDVRQIADAYNIRYNGGGWNNGGGNNRRGNGNRRISIPWPF